MGGPGDGRGGHADQRILCTSRHRARRVAQVAPRRHRARSQVPPLSGAVVERRQKPDGDRTRHLQPPAHLLRPVLRPRRLHVPAPVLDAPALRRPVQRRRGSSALVQQGSVLRQDDRGLPRLRLQRQGRQHRLPPGGRRRRTGQRQGRPALLRASDRRDRMGRPSLPPCGSVRVPPADEGREPRQQEGRQRRTGRDHCSRTRRNTGAPGKDEQRRTRARRPDRGAPNHGQRGSGDGSRTPPSAVHQAQHVGLLRSQGSEEVSDRRARLLSQERSHERGERPDGRRGKVRRLVSDGARNRNRGPQDHRLLGPDRVLSEDAVGEAQVRNGDPVLRHTKVHRRSVPPGGCRVRRTVEGVARTAVRGRRTP